MKYQFELTDTFGGEANYCWVRRTTVDVPDGTPEDLVRRMAKLWAGFGGHRCMTENFGDMTKIRVSGIAQVLFITWAEDDTPRRVADARRKAAAELMRSIRGMWPDLRGQWTRRDWNLQARQTGRQYIRNAIRFEKANAS